MAFVPASSSPDQDPNAQAQGNNPLGQQAPVTSAPPAGAGKAAVTPSNSAPTQPFTNLSSYLTANAPQIQQEGQQIAGNLQGQYGQVMGDINAGTDSFGQQVKSAYTPMDQATIDAFNVNPTAVASNPDQAKSFTGMYGDTYTGPASFETSPTYGNLTGEVQTAASNAANMQTPAGLSSYFSSTAPNYTQGMGTLDSSLLQGNPDVVTNIRSAAQPFAALPGYLSSVVSSADQGVRDATTMAQGAKTAARGAFDTQVGNLDSGVTAKAAADQKTVQDYNSAVQAYQAAIANNIPQANQIASLAGKYGISFNGQQPPVIDPNSISSPNVRSGFPTAAQSASPADYATLSALEKLSGGPVTAPISDSTADQAGTFTAPGSVDTSALTKALDAMQQWAAADGNNASGGNGSDVNSFVPAANNWYVQLLKELGWQNPGTGALPHPFTGPGGGGGLTGPGTPGGV